MIFQKRIKLNSTQVNSNTSTFSMKLHECNIYVMFGLSSPPFHLQIFTLEGELVRCLIEQSEIRCSHLFSIDQLGNIIVTDWEGNKIKITPRKDKYCTPSRVIIYQEIRGLFILLECLSTNRTELS